MEKTLRFLRIIRSKFIYVDSENYEKVEGKQYMSLRDAFEYAYEHTSYFIRYYISVTGKNRDNITIIDIYRYIREETNSGKSKVYEK